MPRFRTSWLALLLAALPAVDAWADPAVIAVDAGHGGESPGAVGPGGLLEKDVTFAVADRLADRLARRGHEVVLVRPDARDVALKDRVDRANRAAADVFVSIHCNSVRRPMRARVRGIETYFLSADATDEAARRLAEAENQGEPGPARLAGDDPLAAILLDLAVSAAHEDSGLLASQVHGALVDRTGWPDRGVRQAPFAVLNGAAMPAILVEVGFISHPDEARQLAGPEGQAELAAAIAEGVEAFLEVMAAREAGAVRVAGR